MTKHRGVAQGVSRSGLSRDDQRVENRPQLTAKAYRALGYHVPGHVPDDVLPPWPLFPPSAS